MAYAVLTSSMPSVSEMGSIGVCVRQAVSSLLARVSIEEGELVMVIVRDLETRDWRLDVAISSL